MTRPDPTYDLVLLLDNEAADDVRAKVLADAERIISGGGTVLGDYDWGNRALAFAIDHKADATYHLVQFHADGPVLDELKRTLSIADGLVRYRIIKLAPGTPAPPSGAPAEAEPAPAA